MKFSDLKLLEFGHSIQLTGAVYSDEQHHYLCLFSKNASPLPIELVDMDDEDWKTMIRQTDLLEAEVLAKSPDGTLAKIILRKSARNIEASISWKVYRRDGFKCRYCGANNVPLTVDHIITWESGGPSTEINLLSSCKSCNNARGTMLYEEWLRSPRYLATSKKLDESVLKANEAIVNQLDLIPRRYQKRSR